MILDCCNCGRLMDDGEADLPYEQGEYEPASVLCPMCEDLTIKFDIEL